MHDAPPQTPRIPRTAAEWSAVTLTPRIVAVDSSIRMPGFAVVGYDEVFYDWRRPDGTDLPLGGRIALYVEALLTLVGEHLPAEVVVEHNVKSGLKDSAASRDMLSLSRGLAYGALAAIGYSGTVAEVTVGEVRLMMCGRERASKVEAVRGLLARGYDLPKDGAGVVIGDVADALNLGLMQCYKRREGMLIGSIGDRRLSTGRSGASRRPPRGRGG